MSKKDNEKQEYLKELILARLDVMPQDYKLSVGNQGTFTKDQLMEHVREGNQIGEQIIGMQMQFIKALASGEVTKLVTQ